MIRKFVASKRTILLIFSLGRRRYSSVFGPKFTSVNGEKTLYNWKPSSQTRASDHLREYRNHRNELHESKTLEMDTSLEDEFAELGPSVTSEPIHPKDNTYTMIPDNFKIRISTLGTELSEVAVHDICSSHGPISGLVRRKDGTLEVLFRVENKSEAQTIVNKLNNGTKLSAELIPSETASKSSCDNSDDLQIEEVIRSFRKQLELQRIYLEDLEHLHRAVSHLKSHPTKTNSNFGYFEKFKSLI